MEKTLSLLLIYPDFLESEKYTRGKLGNYSEGLASISAVLKNAGYSVELYHQCYMPDEKEFIEKVQSFNSNLIGFTARTTAIPFITEMCSWLKQSVPEKMVVIGGYHPTLVPEEVLAIEGCDAVVVGEGEYPTLELMDCISKGEDYTNIQSIFFKTPEGDIIKNPIRPLLEDLDELPFPDFELFDFENLDRSKNFTAMVMLSRGCLFSCTYCGNSQFRNVYPNKSKYSRFRSPQKSIELLELLLEKYPFIKFLEFRDAIFNMYKDWFYEFMPMYIERINLPFNCNLRFDMLDEDMVRMLKEGGCYMIDIGLETGNEEFRTKYLRRKMKNDHIIEVSKWFRKYKITTLTYNIVGLPYETLELSLETIKLNAKMDVDKVTPNIFYPYPMTVLEQTAKDAGFIDPSVDPNDPVQLRMPQYKKSDILFISTNFNRLVKKYKAIFALPPEIAKKKEEKLDKRIISKYYPRFLLYKIAYAKRRAMVVFKRTLKKVSPKLFVFLKGKTMREMTS